MECTVGFLQLLGAWYHLLKSWLNDKHGHVVCHHLWMVLLGVVLYEMQACLYVYFILLHAIQLSF